MFRKTTFNIEKDIYNTISDYAKKHGKTRSDVIIVLLYRIMNDKKTRTRIDRCVLYQKHQRCNIWHKFYIRLDINDYEYFVDMRKFFKMSVSHLLACAFHEYQLEFKNNDGYMYKYTQKNYILIKDEIDGIIFWKIFWGYPLNISQYLPKNQLFGNNT